MPSCRYLRMLGVASIAFVVLACDAGSVALTSVPPTSTSGVPSTGAPTKLGRRTKTSGCLSTNALPDPACTPGDIFPDATVDKICVPGYSSSVRDVPTYIKDKVYAEYGIPSHEPGQ